MDNETTIKILEYIKSHKADPDNEEKEAIDFAIKALKRKETQGDLISRSALKEVIETYRPIPITSDYSQGKNNMVDYCIAEIDNAPTVAVDEEIERQREEFYQSSKKLFDTARMLGVAKPKGEWIKDEEGKTVCSNCGFESLYSEDGFLYSLGNFCPNCGADMRGDTE